MADPFENALRGLEEVGASASDHRLVDLLAKHGAAEDEVLDRYERFAGQARSPAVRYLVRLIAEDERRHHRLLVELANAVAWGWSALSPEPAIPELPVGVDVDADLVAETTALLQIELADERELKALRGEVEPYADTTLWSLIIDLMLADTRKHLRILQFIRSHPELPVVLETHR